MLCVSIPKGDATTWLYAYPSYFTLQVRWLRSLTPVTDLCTFPGLALLPPSCSANYLGY